MSTKVNLVALGGVRENGKNMYAIEVDDQIFVVDFGLKYPDNELLGIDIVIPDLTYLEENVDRVSGIFLTHGHADAIGALPYFVAEHPVPVFGSELTVELAKIVTKSDPRAKKFNDFHVINDRSVIDFGDVKSPSSRRHTAFQAHLGSILKHQLDRLSTQGTSSSIKVRRPTIKPIMPAWHTLVRIKC